MLANIQAEVDVECSVAPFVRLARIVFHVELAPSSEVLILQELGKPVDILDIVANHSSTDEIAAE